MDNAKINLIGTVVGKIEFFENETEKSKQRIVFSILVPTGAKDKNQNYISNFYKITQFGVSSANTNAKIQKGTQVFVNGNLSVTAYLNNEKQPAPSCNVVANDVIILQKAKGTGGVVPGAPAAQMQDISETSVDDIFGIDS